MPKSLVAATIFIDALVTVVVLTTITVLGQGCGSGMRATADPFTYTSSCAVYEDLGINIETTQATIPKIVKNPCAAQNIIATTVKAGVILDAYQAEEFIKWAQATQDFIAIGMPFRDVRECVGAKIPELSDRLGMEYITISDMLEAIPGENRVSADDYKILLNSLDDLVAQVNKMKKISAKHVRRYLRTSRFRS